MKGFAIRKMHIFEFVSRSETKKFIFLFIDIRMVAAARHCTFDI